MFIIQKGLEKKKNRLIKQEKYNDKTIVWEELSTKMVRVHMLPNGKLLKRH